MNGELREKESEAKPYKISAVKTIENRDPSSHQIIKTREKIKEMVELPLISACEELYDKNIRTVSTSANESDIKLGYAIIIIDFKTLSDKNKEIGKELGELSDEELVIKIPVNENSTVEEVKNSAESVAHKFVKQIMRWVPHYTIEQLRSLYAIDPNDQSYGIDSFTDKYYYSPDYKLFFRNEEHFKKATEEIEE